MEMIGSSDTHKEIPSIHLPSIVHKDEKTASERELLHKVGRVSHAILFGVLAFAAFTAYVAYQNSFTLDPKEIEVMNTFGFQALSLDPAERLPKALYMLPKSDYNNAGQVFNDGMILSFGVDVHLKTLSRTHDVMFKVISNPLEICTLIKSATKIGDLKTVVIAGHGSEDSIHINDHIFGDITSDIAGNVYGLSKNCFSTLPEDAQITLLSCQTGSTHNGIAWAIAQLSQRTVWAPDENALVALTRFSNGVPAKPTFLSSNRFLKDITCKFTPDGLRTCGFWETKFTPFINRVIPT